MSIIEERPLFLICGGLLVGFHCLTYILSDASQNFALIVANTLITHTYVWNMVTSSFFETSPVKLAVDVVILWFVSKHVGKPNVEQFGLYFAFAILSCSMGTSVIRFFQFVSSGHEQTLLAATTGFSGIIQAFLMYTRHVLRSQPIHPKMFPSITYHFAPTLYVAVQIIFRILGFRSFAQDFSFTIIGMIFSWTYLKFFYKHSETEPPGDRTEDFTFVRMFPETIHSVLIPFTTAFYNVMVLVGVFPALESNERKFHHHLRSGASTSITGSGMVETKEESTVQSKPSSKAEIVAERRKARALKMLDAKMAELAKEVEGWDDEIQESSSLAEEGRSQTFPR
jgi:hypothetical protein